MRNYLYAITSLVLLFQLRCLLANCDVCHSGNPTACHNETTYSLCVDGFPSYEIVHCPPNYVCTSQPRVCYPKVAALPFCNPTNRESRCGICNDIDQVFSCLDKTTIAFCFGNDTPDYTAIAYCPDRSVCDLNNVKFCSDADIAQPSCRKEINTSTPNGPITVAEPTTTTTGEITAITTTDIPPSPTTISEELITTLSPATTTTANPKTTLEPTTTTPNFITTITPKPTTTSRKPTTTTTSNPSPTTTKPTTTTPNPTTATPNPTTTTPKPTTPKPTMITPQPTTTPKPTMTTSKPTTTTPSTTTTTEPTTTTTRKPRDPNTFCRETNKPGSYKPDGDTECRSFILCWLRNGAIAGMLMSCQNPTPYFNEEISVCAADKPYGCP